MTAIFGHLGPCSDSLMNRMEQALSHRGQCHAALAPSSGGFLAACGEHPGTDLASTDTLDRLVNEARTVGQAKDPFEPGEIDRLLRDNTAMPYSYEGGMRIWTVIMTLLWNSFYNTPRPELQEMVTPHG